MVVNDKFIIQPVATSAQSIGSTDKTIILPGIEVLFLECPDPSLRTVPTTGYRLNILCIADPRISLPGTENPNALKISYLQLKRAIFPVLSIAEPLHAKDV